MRNIMALSLNFEVLLVYISASLQNQPFQSEYFPKQHVRDMAFLHHHRQCIFTCADVHVKHIVAPKHLTILQMCACERVRATLRMTYSRYRFLFVCKV